MTAIQNAKIPASRWWRVGIPLLVIYLLAFIDRTNVGIAAPSMMTALELSGVAFGVLSSAFFWGYVLTMVPGGMLAKKTNAVAVISWAMIVVGVTACLTGVVTDFTLLLVVRFIMGLAEGVLFPAFSVMFVKWFPSHERGRAVSLSTFAIPLAAAIAAPLGGWLISQWNYTVMFIVQGAPAIAAGVLFLLLASKDPATDRRISDAERAHILDNRDAGMQVAGKFRDVLNRPMVWILAALYFLWMSALYGFNLWLPTLVKSLSAGGIGAVGLISAIPFLLGLIGMYVVSRLSDTSRRSRGWYIAVPVAIGGLALLLQHFLTLGLTGSIVLLCVAGFGIYAPIGNWWTWVISLFPTEQAGPTVGLVNVFGNFGGIVAPPLLSIVGGAAGAGSAFYILGFSGIIAAIMAAAIASRSSRRNPVHA